MNKTLQSLFCFCAAAVVFGSCQKDEPIDATSPRATSSLRVKVANSYTPNESNAKVVLEGLTPKFEGGEAVWVNGESVSVTLDGSGNPEVVPPSAETYYAVYPYNSSMGTGSGAYPSIPLNTEQSYVSNEDDEYGTPIQQINAPMVAYSEGGELSFNNICALVRVRVRNNMGRGNFTLSSITVTSTTNYLAGTMTYNDETGEFSITSGGKKYVTLTGLTETVKENKSSQDYYIYIPPVSGEILTVSVQGSFADEPLMMADFYQVSTNAVSIAKSKTGVVSQLLNACGHHYTRPFSVSASKKVYFSPGNLQYQASTGKWRFADEQWISFINDASFGNIVNHTNSETTDKWIDLFGWGTSGWNNSNTYYMPWNKMAGSTSGQGYGYGPKGTGDYKASLTGDYANADWGVYNAIENGDRSDAAGTWRTMTGDEWSYLLGLTGSRPNATVRRTAATINEKKGYILLPDTWSLPVGVSMTTNATAYNSNVYTIEDWRKLEAEGAIFLPVTGYRAKVTNASTNPTISDQSYCFYWTATTPNTGFATRFYQAGNTPTVNAAGTTTDKYKGYAVRLVRNAN